MGELNSQGELDAHLDRLGQFTFSLQPTIEKVRDLSRQIPARWILFAVQAAVGWRASRVEIQLRPASLSLRLELGEEPPPELAQPESLLEPPDSAEPALTDFRRALVWLRALEPKRLELLFQGPKGGYLLGLAEAPSQAAAQVPSARASLDLSADFADSHQLAGCGRELEHRLSFCPVPVRLNGVELQCGSFPEVEEQPCLACRYILPEPQATSLLTVQHPRQLPALVYRVEEYEFERPRTVSPGARLARLEVAGSWSGPCRLSRLIQPEGMVLSHWREHGGDFYLCNAAVPAVAASISGMLACQAYFHRVREGVSQLWVVQRGCRMEPMPLYEVEQGWSVALAADVLETDLTALKLVESHALQQSLDWAREQILNLHQRASATSRPAD